METVGHHQAKKYMHYGNKRRREGWTWSLFKAIMAENFPNLRKDMDIQVYNILKSLNSFKQNKTSWEHIIIKLSKIKGNKRILKARREKRLFTYKGTTIRLSVDFSANTLQATTEWEDIWKMLVEKNTNKSCFAR